MKKIKITFRFILGSPTSAMEVAYEGEGITQDAAIGDAWHNMAKGQFDKNIILKTSSIEIKEVESIA